MSETCTVTGAFGYSGKYIARRLLNLGVNVRSLTNSIGRENPFGGQVEAHPFHFDQPGKLIRSLEGTKILFNTYWVRFKHLDFSHALAVKHSKTLFEAAKEAGVERIVHTSITNPSRNSPLEYFSGKAEVEDALLASGLSYAILRPAVLFGPEDILINNIAWLLRHCPVFGLFGRGEYKLQPIYVDDFAKLAVEQGFSKNDCIIDAIGPETFSYRKLVESIAKTIGRKRWIFPMPYRLVYQAAKVIGYINKDMTITWEEILGLTRNLLYTPSSPAGTTRLTDWIMSHRESVGRHYASELGRRQNRNLSYETPVRGSNRHPPPHGSK